MATLRVGDRVWVGAPTAQTPGHILSVHRRSGGRVEYVIRTIDLGGGPGENLNLRVRETGSSELVRPRAASELIPDAPAAAGAGHGAR